MLCLPRFNNDDKTFTLSITIILFLNFMTQFQSEFLKTLHERGFIHAQTDADALDKQCLDGTISAYIGFDATASSLHVGSLVQIMMLKHLQLCGHTPIVLMGGGTTKVGDPSGKDESRKILDDNAINQNIVGIQKIFGQFIDFETLPNKAIMVNNDDWLSKLNYIDFLRDFGRHFSINRMLTFDSVKLRLDREQPLSFLEFNYMILQGYDFVELKQRYNCILQMGGSDQWGNIINGVELGRRTRQYQLFGLTTPLLTTASGAKMGKTADGAVWLNPEMLSDYDYWQFWRNTADSDVVKFLKLFTLLPLDEIARLGALQGSELNEAKKILATEATKLARGEDAAQTAAQTAQNAFVMGTTEGLPETILQKSEFENGYHILDLLVFLDLAPTKSEARRLIKGGGIKLNDIAATEFVIGHLYGGIQSPMTNAFSTNQTNATSADPTIYEVKLVYNPSLNVATMEGKNSFTFSVSPNPTNNDTVRIQFNLPYVATLDYFITSLDGKMLDDGEIEGLQVGNNEMNFSLENAKEKIVILTFILDNKFYASQKIIRNQ